MRLLAALVIGASLHLAAACLATTPTDPPCTPPGSTVTATAPTPARQP